MPGFDGTGPAGQGAATGWGRGGCAGGATRPAYGGGMGFGAGFGRRGGGRGRGFAPGYGIRPMTREERITMLENELEALRSQNTTPSGS